MLANPTGLPVLLPFLAKNLHFLNSATLSLAEFLLFTLCSVQTGCRLSNAKSGKNGNSASVRAHEFDSPLPKAVSDKTGMVFGNVKIGFNIGCVVIALVVSLILFNGEIVGTREGTVLSALLTGVIVNFFVKRISEPVKSILSD